MVEQVNGTFNNIKNNKKFTHGAFNLSNQDWSNFNPYFSSINKVTFNSVLEIDVSYLYFSCIIELYVSIIV